jgi:preprotein translocase subunit Sec61beta
MEQEDVPELDPEVTMRSAGLIKFSENDESRYLGPSSGIAVTRLVMDQ